MPENKKETRADWEIREAISAEGLPKHLAVQKFLRLTAERRKRASEANTLNRGRPGEEPEEE